MEQKRTLNCRYLHLVFFACSCLVDIRRIVELCVSCENRHVLSCQKSLTDSPCESLPISVHIHQVEQCSGVLLGQLDLHLGLAKQTFFCKEQAASHWKQDFWVAWFNNSWYSSGVRPWSARCEDKGSWFGFCFACFVLASNNLQNMQPSSSFSSCCFTRSWKPPWLQSSERPCYFLKLLANSNALCY